MHGFTIQRCFSSLKTVLWFQVSDSDAPEAERNMAAGEGLSHSSLIKTTSPAVSSNTELSPDVDQELWSSDQGQEGFPDGVYLLASVIFQNDHLERPAEHCKVNYVKDRELPLPEVKGEEMQQAAYQLAFDTLKCECASGLSKRTSEQPNWSASFTASFTTR